MSAITDSIGSVIYQRLMRNMYTHMTKKLEAMLLGKGYVLVEGAVGDYVPDHIVYEIAHDFWRCRIKYESPLRDSKDVQEDVDYMVNTDGRPQVHIREILSALAEDGIVPVLKPAHAESGLGLASAGKDGEITKLRPTDILAYLGFQVDAEGIEINPVDSFVIKAGLRLAGQVLASHLDAISEDQLRRVHEGMHDAAMDHRLLSVLGPQGSSPWQSAPTFDAAKARQFVKLALKACGHDPGTPAKA